VPLVQLIMVLTQAWMPVGGKKTYKLYITLVLMISYVTIN